jgi:hypothetical protein
LSEQVLSEKRPPNAVSESPLYPSLFCDSVLLKKITRLNFIEESQAMRHIYPVGLTACSRDSWRDTVHNIPMMLLCHVCYAGHPYEGLSSLPFWKAIAVC